MAISQPLGAALNLNVDRHALLLDGINVEEGGILRFHEAMPPTDEQMDPLLLTIDRRIHRLLARRRVLDDLGEGLGSDSWRVEAPGLAGIAEASIQSRRALGSGPVRWCAGLVRRRNRSRWRRPTADPVTPGGAASISTPASSWLLGIGRGSNGCAVTRFVLPSRPTGCAGPPQARCSSISAAPLSGRTTQHLFEPLELV